MDYKGGLYAGEGENPLFLRGATFLMSDHPQGEQFGAEVSPVLCLLCPGVALPRNKIHWRKKRAIPKRQT